MNEAETLLLTRGDIASLLGIEECMTAVERAFKLHAEGKTLPPGILGLLARDGGFHIKAGILDLSRSYFAAKVNANFPENSKRFGLPLIQGAIVLCDGENGRLLAVMDSMEITVIRTGAATGVAAKYLARNDSTTVTICGCGNQGRISLKAIANVRDLNKVYAFDIDSAQAEQFAGELSQELRIEIHPVTDLRDALKQSDICVTCTPARKYFLKKEDVVPGILIAAVGADNEDKQELDPTILPASKLVVDLLEQCATIGELHHALDEKLMTKDQVHAELGEIIAERKPGRISSDEVIVFDSTGTALQDVASAAIVYERAVAQGRGIKIDFGI